MHEAFHPEEIIPLLNHSISLRQFVSFEQAITADVITGMIAGQDRACAVRTNEAKEQ